jgi:hypothetical protein
VTVGQDNSAPAAPDKADQDAACWKEAARLRAEHRGWIVIWLSRDARFRAYRRLPGARHDTALSAVTASDVAAQIRQAEQGASRPARRVQDQP